MLAKLPVFRVFDLMCSRRCVRYAHLRRAVLRAVLVLCVLAFLAVNKSLEARNIGSQLHRVDLQNSKRCETKPTLLIVVLASTRPQSLKRLLLSLTSAKYACARVDLHIHIDARKNSTTDSDCLRVSTNHTWPFGSKSVTRRFNFAGLAQSWFEAVYYTNAEYIAIFEDDEQVQEHFYTFFSLMHEKGVLKGAGITAFCLHPGDWEVSVKTSCTSSQYSKFLYLSPEPCNWGPIWKSSEWRKYIDWVHDTKNSGHMPFVPEDISYNYNFYIDNGNDVQSPWVWAYNFKHSKQQVRYSFNRCGGPLDNEIFFVVNHKEPGENFKKKNDLHSSPDLLKVDIDKCFEKLLANENAFNAQPFGGYEKNQQSMRPRPKLKNTNVENSFDQI